MGKFKNKGKRKNFFFRKLSFIDDWVPVDFEQCSWDLLSLARKTRRGFHLENKICTYTIWYSKSRNEHKLTYSGWNATEHPVYQMMYNNLIRLQNK